MEPEIEVHFELPGWSLYFARLRRVDGYDNQLSHLRQETVARIRQRLELQALSTNPTVAALRRLFRAAGCDPTRYRPSSEALTRRVLKGAELPPINPLVDLNNCLSLELTVPCCVMAEEAIRGPYVLRAGRPGESYDSLKGPFNLEGKPLLVDAVGPCDAPITGSQRVKIREETREATLVAYLPQSVVTGSVARRGLERLLAVAPVAELLGSCHRPTETEQSENDQHR